MSEDSNAFMSVKSINLVPVDDLIPYDKNPRKHSDKSVDAICAAIDKYGFNMPVVVNQDNRIIAGHGRRLAAIKLGLRKVPTVVVTTADEKEFVSMVLSDNKVQEFSKWDNDLLKFTMDFLREDNIEFDMPAGFEAVDVDKIFGHKHDDVSTSSDAEADFGDAGVKVQSEMDDRALIKRKTFMLTQKEYVFVTDKLKAVKKEHGLDTEAEALFHILKPIKGLTKVVTKKGAAKSIEV